MIPTTFIKTNTDEFRLDGSAFLQTDEFRLDGLQEGRTVCIAINGIDLHISQYKDHLSFDIYDDETHLDTMGAKNN